MRHCDECKGDILCLPCKIQVSEIKIRSYFKFLKRPAPNQFGHMLPFYNL